MFQASSSPRTLLSRRSILASLGSVGVVALLAACGSSRPAITAGSSSAATTTTGSAAANSTPDAAATAKAAGYTAAAPTATVGQIKSTGKNGTIQYWHNHSGPELAPLNANIQEFTKLKDIGVEATYVPVPAGTQESPKLIAAIAGGTPPDAARFDRFIVGSFAFTGSLADLSSLAAKAGITSKDYYNFSWSEASLAGKLYAAVRAASPAAIPARTAPTTTGRATSPRPRATAVPMLAPMLKPRIENRPSMVAPSCYSGGRMSTLGAAAQPVPALPLQPPTL